MANEYTDTNSKLFKQESVSITDSEVALLTSTVDIDDRQFVRVYNDSSVTVYIGPTGVTSSGSTRGVPLRKGEWEIYAIKGQQLYGITELGKITSVIVTDLG